MTRKKRPALLRKGPPSLASIQVVFIRLGGDPKQLTLRAGATIEELIRSEGIKRGVPRVNGQQVSLSTELRNGDVVVLLPESIRGSAGRYAHLDLAAYRKAMPPRDYDFFVRFIGADALGFREEDPGDVPVP